MNKKVALLFICTSPLYWPYAKEVIEGAKKYFLPDYKVDYFLWTDMPENDFGATIFETQAAEWPYPTLMRYHLFLQQEETLKNYDYLFYCDIDMKFVGTVGEEIFGDGLTAAEHPMYALRKHFHYPFEPDKRSAAYVPCPHYYFAGGFQGGKSQDYLKAMKVMKKSIDDDFMKNYIARWNDESHWNKYLWDNPPSVILSPAYVYPDSLIKEYYEKIWGRSYEPKIVTLTKKFSTTNEGGTALNEFLKSF